MHWTKWISAALSPFLAGAVFAQQSVAPPPRPATAWEVNWGSHFCSMIRRPAEGRPFSTVIAMVPGTDVIQLLLFRTAPGSLPRGISSVVLMPAARAFDVASQPERRAEQDLTAVYGLSTDFMNALAGASELELRGGGEVRARIPLANIRAALAAHRRCNTQVLNLWGIDEAALAALTRQPETSNNFGLRASDYPAAALRTATQGRVVVRTSVTVEGRASECTVMATSDNAQLDATTCRVILARGRYRPALDAAGRPVAARFIAIVNFRIAA